MSKFKEDNKLSLDLSLQNTSLTNEIVCLNDQFSELSINNSNSYKSKRQAIPKKETGQYRNLRKKPGNTEKRNRAMPKFAKYFLAFARNKSIKKQNNQSIN